MNGANAIKNRDQTQVRAARTLPGLEHWRFVTFDLGGNTRMLAWTGNGFVLQKEDFSLNMDISLTMRPRPVRFGNMDWFLANMTSLVAKYPDEWLAISNQNVIAHSPSLPELQKMVQAKGIENPFVTLASLKGWDVW